MPKYDKRNTAVTFPGQVQTKEQLQFLVVSFPQDHHQIPTENTNTHLKSEILALNKVIVRGSSR